MVSKKEGATLLKKIWEYFISFIIPLVLTIAAVLAFQNYVGQIVRVSGSSMYPTLENKERVYLNHLDKTYTRGKIIVFDAPDGSGDEYVKRVIGVPGDTIEYRDNVLYVNGEKVDEPYLDTLKSEYPGQDVTPNFTLDTLKSTQTHTVPEGKLFVMGDNRPVSKDSEEFGFIDQSAVKGTTSFILWPISDFGSIPYAKNY